MDRRPEDPERPPGRTAAVAAVACFAAVGALAWVGAGPWRTQRGWEVDATRAAADLPETLRLVLWPSMQLGNRFVALGIVVVLAVAGRRWAAAILGASALGAYLASTALKALVDRPRLDPVVLGRPRWEEVHDAALPSTHTAIAVAVATAAIAVFGRRAWWVGAVAALAALARLHAGVHTLVDVAAGAALGAGVALAVVAVARPPAPEVGATSEAWHDADHG